MTVVGMDATPLLPLETPVLKVSRPVAACSRCRNAKIKCDGKLPACSSCEKNGRAAECTSTNDQFARGKERSYVSTLETRIDKLQAKLDDARARKPSVVSIPDDDSAKPSRRQSRVNQEPETPNTSRQLKRREASAIDDLVSDFGFLSVNATARDFYGFTSAMSYARLILSACSKDDLPQGTGKALPARHIATALVQHYLQNIFVLLPMFDETSFYASVENIYSKDGRKAGPLDHWMIRMVLAIASASMSTQRGDQRYMDGIGHVCAAMTQAEAVLHPGNISGVQALILLTQYAMLDPHHFDSWSLIGAASRAMTDLGLHQDPLKGTPMTKFKLELRRRVFHCVYALDRSTSLVQTRAFSFSDDSAKVKIPFTKQPSSAPGSPAAGQQSPQPQWSHGNEQALHLIRIRQIQSGWYTELFQSGRTRWQDPYTYLWDTCGSMRQWHDEMPAPTPANMRTFFELELLYSYIYVLSPSPRVPTIAPFAQKLIFEYSIRYAELMLQVITDTSYHTPLTFYDAMRVYMTGRQFLDVLQHNKELLLNGLIPPHPDVKSTAAAPPQMPVPPLPQGETLQHFSIVRAIDCIKNITECLARFGLRWGYMSWNQRYQNETSAMLEDLTQRLRSLDELRGTHESGMWHQGSIGSIASSNGSINYLGGVFPSTSPPQRVSQGSELSQTAFPMHQYAQLGDSRLSTGIRQSSPFYAQPLQGNSGSTFANQAASVYDTLEISMYPQKASSVSSNGYPFPSQQSSELNGNAHAQSTFPSMQNNSLFAGWAGYRGPVVERRHDEENAGVCPISPGQLLPEQIPPGMSSDMQPDATHMTRNHQHASMWPPVAPEHTTAMLPHGLSEATWQRHAMPRYYGASSSALYQRQPSLVPPLTGADQISGPIYIHQTSMPQRRVSMLDAATNVMQSTYPSHQTSTVTTQMTSGNRSESKGKGKARERPRRQSVQPSLVVDMNTEPAVRHIKGLGTICVACSRLYPRPGLHRTLLDGSGCVDVQPLQTFSWQQQQIPSSVPPSSPTRPTPVTGPIVPSGSVDMGLHSVDTNDSLLMGEAVPSGPVAQMPAQQSEEGSAMHKANLIEQLTWAEQCARKFSESGGLFF